MALTALAPAKVNLFLHVGPPGGDGYHPLCSLVAFADVGDRLRMERAAELSLTVEGPFAAGLQTDDNLVLRALRALGRATGLGDPPVRVVLDKRLPVASGLGGGSSDAATALRLARDLLGLEISDLNLARVAGEIGADGPMCLLGRAAWAEGRGDRLEPEGRLPSLHGVLINPGAASPTGQVYQAYDEAPTGEVVRPAPPEAWDASRVIDWMANQRNDLEAAAVGLQPLIATALDEARATAGARLVRMSGSGATVFALYENERDAAAAAAQVSQTRPDWWIAKVMLK